MAKMHKKSLIIVRP